MPKTYPGFFLALALLCSACNSGSPHSTSTPPATPTFTTFDAPENPLTNLPLNSGPTIVSTIPTDINASGYIAGYGSYGLADSIGFLRTPDGTINSLPTPVSGAMQGTQCLNINIASAAICTENNGISGFAGSGEPILSVGSVVWNASGNVKIVVVPANNGVATAIDDGGDVAGVCTIGTGSPYGFLLTSGGTFTSFTVPNATTFSVSRVSNSDQIIGTFRDNIGAIHGFLRSADGTVTQIDAPNTGSESDYGTTLNGMNAGGIIVGSASSSSGAHSFSRTSDGAFAIFDPPGTGSVGSSASGINSSGVIVGTFTDDNSLTHGYILNLNGTFTIIDDPDADQAPRRGTSLNRINDSGQIVGNFVDSQNLGHGFLYQ